MRALYGMLLFCMIGLASDSSKTSNAYNVPQAHVMTAQTTDQNTKNKSNLCCKCCDKCCCACLSICAVPCIIIHYIKTKW